MQYFKPVNKQKFEFEDKLRQLSDKELEQFCILAKQYGLSDKQIKEGLEYIQKIRH
jgi:hypothetical protein